MNGREDRRVKPHPHVFNTVLFTHLATLLTAQHDEISQLYVLSNRLTHDKEIRTLSYSHTLALRHMLNAAVSRLTLYFLPLRIFIVKLVVITIASAFPIRTLASIMLARFPSASAPEVRKHL